MLEYQPAQREQFLYALRRDFGWNAMVYLEFGRKRQRAFLYALRRDFGWNIIVNLVALAIALVLSIRLAA